MLISPGSTSQNSAPRLLARTGGQVLPSLYGIAHRQRLPGYMLRPGQVLYRTQMVRLSVAWKKLAPLANAARAWELVQCFFPEMLEKLNPDNLALDTLPHLLHRVEDAGWWEIDWRTLDWLYELAVNSDDGDRKPWEQDWGSDEINSMLACLYYIPVRQYNWSDEEWWNMEQYPLLIIFKEMLDRNCRITTGYEEIDSFQPTPAWVKMRCDILAERGERLAILPKLVDYVLKETGNDLLDNHSAGNEMMDWPVGMGYRWDSVEDIETLKRLYAEAGPVWREIEELCEHFSDGDSLSAFIEEFFYGEIKDETGDDE